MRLRRESGEIMSRIQPDSWEIDQALQLTVEDDFSYRADFSDLFLEKGYRILVVEDMPSATKATTALEQLVRQHILLFGWEMQGGVSLVYDTKKESYSAAQSMKITGKK